VAADVDDDGDVDLFVANLLGESDSYYRNDGGRFSDRTSSAGLGAASRRFTRFGAGMYDFDKDGVLESWTDVANDEYNGLSVTCLPDGRAWYLAYYKDGRVVGISRSWRAKDGSFAYAMDHDAQGRTTKVNVPAALQQRPDHLCQIAKCDVNATPDLSGVPKP